MTTEVEATNGHAKGEPVLPADVEPTDAWTDILGVLTKSPGTPLTAQEISEQSGRHQVTVNELCKKHRGTVKQDGYKGKARCYVLREKKPKAKAKAKSKGKPGKSNIQKSLDTLTRMHAILAETTRPLSALEIQARMSDVVAATIYSALKRSNEVAIVGTGDHGIKLYALKISKKRKKVEAADAVEAVDRYVKVSADKETELLELTRRIITLEAELATAKTAFAKALGDRYR